MKRLKKLKEHAKQIQARLGLHPKNCAVVGCQTGNVEVIDVKPLDPIDHDSTLLQLCPRHSVWAEKRNDLAEEVYEALVEKRKEIGQDRIGEIQDLALPQDGRLREDILMGDPPEDKIPLADAMEGQQ